MKTQLSVTTLLVENSNQELPQMIWARLTNIDHEPVTVMENVVLKYMEPVEYGPFTDAQFQLVLNPGILAPDSKIKIRVEYAAVA